MATVVYSCKKCGEVWTDRKEVCPNCWSESYSTDWDEEFDDVTDAELEGFDDD